MTVELGMEQSFNNIFGVKHYNVRIVKRKENVLKYIISVLSYALFIWLLFLTNLKLKQKESLFSR